MVYKVEIEQRLRGFVDVEAENAEAAITEASRRFVTNGEELPDMEDGETLRFSVPGPVGKGSDFWENLKTPPAENPADKKYAYFVFREKAPDKPVAFVDKNVLFGFGNDDKDDNKPNMISVFPDKDFVQNIREGLAVINAIKVRRDTYAFVECEMIPLSLPEQRQLCDWLCNRKHPQKISILKNAKTGEKIVSVPFSNMYFASIPGCDMQIVDIPKDASFEEEFSVGGNAYIAKCLHGCAVDDILRKFKGLPSSPVGLRMVEETTDPLFERLCSIGFVKLTTRGNNTFFCVPGLSGDSRWREFCSDSIFHLLSTFTTEEIDAAANLLWKLAGKPNPSVLA